jgi:hypothetical protein
MHPAQTKSPASFLNQILRRDPGMGLNLLANSLDAREQLGKVGLLLVIWHHHGRQLAPLRNPDSFSSRCSLHQLRKLLFCFK